jgi:hypothetical protein
VTAFVFISLLKYRIDFYEIRYLQSTFNMRWAAFVAHMGVGEVYTGYCWGNLGERDHLEDPDVDRDNIKMGL